MRCRFHLIASPNWGIASALREANLPWRTWERGGNYGTYEQIFPHCVCCCGRRRRLISGESACRGDGCLLVERRGGSDAGGQLPWDGAPGIRRRRGYMDFDDQFIVRVSIHLRFLRERYMGWRARTDGRIGIQLFTSAVTDTMTFTFTTPVSAVGGFVNYAVLSDRRLAARDHCLGLQSHACIARN